MRQIRNTDFGSMKPMANGQLRMNKMISTRLSRPAVLIMYLLLEMVSSSVFAADTNSPPKGASTSTNDTSKASTSKGTTSSDAASFTISNLQIETDILANRSVRSIAGTIGDSIVGSGPKSIAFYDDSSYQAAVQYQVVMHYLQNMVQQYQRILQLLPDNPDRASLQDANVALTAAQGIAQSITDIINMLRTDVTVEGRSITVADSTIIASVAQRIRGTKPELKCYYPLAFAPLPDPQHSEIQGLIDSVNNLRATIVAKLSSAKSDTQPQGDAPAPATGTGVPSGEKTDGSTVSAARPKTPPQDKTGGSGGTNGTDATTHQTAKLDMNQFVQSLNATTENFLASLYGSTNGATMGALLRAEATSKLLKDGNSDLVYIHFVNAGGNNATKRNLFTAIFTSPKVLHSGGSIIGFIQFKQDGTIRNSGVFDAYSGYYSQAVSSKGKLAPNFDASDSDSRPTTGGHAKPSSPSKP